MKKIILVLSAVLLSTGAFAQNRGFEWGVKAGLNLSTVTKFDDTKFKPGFAAGVFGEYVISDFFGVQAELLYSMAGFKYKEGGLELNDKRDYLILPILAKFYILERLSVDIGPQFGYALSGKLDLDAGEFTGAGKYYDDDFKKFDITAAMGLSYKFGFGLDVFARYNLGLTKLFDNKAPLFGKDAKNSAIQVGVGYRF